MPRPEYTVAQPARRPDGSWAYPLQVVIQTVGKYATGSARFEIIGWACDPEHRDRLQRCLV